MYRFIEKYLGRLLLFFCCAGCVHPCIAQQGNAVSDTDSLTQKNVLKELRLDSVDQRRIDTTHLYKKLKRKMDKHRVSRAVFEFLFRDPYSRTVSRTPTSPIDPNCAYEGRFIGNIQIQRLDPFGPRVTDTLRTPANWFERAGNAMHRDTRESVIRKSLLFQHKYPFIASMVSDNERILRLTPNLLDARIYAIPRKGSADTVDILVVTQDVWSINGSIDTDFQQNAGINVDDLNFLGLGHEKALGVSYNMSPHPYYHKPKGWSIQSLYQIPYIGKTFITGTLQYINSWNQERYALVGQRNFLTPSMKYAGGLELSRNRLFVEVDPYVRDSTVFPVGYDYADLWLGRSFRTQWAGERTRMILAARVIGNRYWERPEVRSDTNQLYEHRWLNLYSIGFSTRNYLRDVLIYGFGRTEDVPYGSMVSFTTGMERREFGVRSYIGMKAAHGQYFQRFGYLLLSFNAGSYIHKGLWEQGVWRGEVNYFSRLLPVGTSQLRQFVHVRYTKGFGRFNGEYIDINNSNGIRGISNVGLRGQQSMVLNMETVLFTPLNILGFQIAMFGYVDLGWIGNNSREVVDTPLYQGYGIGIRLRNENLTFNTFQFRVGLYNGFSGLISPFRSEFSEIPRSRLTDFDISAPEVVPFGKIGIQQ